MSPMTYSSSSSSKKTSYASSGDVPLSAERAMMDEIRSKLERTQRRLARNAPSSATSVTSVSSKSPFLSSSSSSPPIIVASSRNNSSSRHHNSTVPFADAQSGASSSKSQLPRRQHALPLSSTRRPLSSTNHSTTVSSATALASTMRYAQYKSRSKYANSSATFDTDPLNGGPPSMSTPYLVYSSSRVPMSNSSSSRPSLATQPRSQQETSHHVPSTVPAALRLGIAARPPSSRVRFQSHETRDRADDNDAIADGAIDDDVERKRRQALVKEREARHVRHRELELQKSRETGPLSPIATATRGRRSDNPPSSAIKLSAYDEILPSTVGRLRRSSIGQSPPKSDIQVSAYEEVRPRRRSSQEALEKRRKELKEEEEEEEEERRRRRRREEEEGVDLVREKVPLVLRPRGGRRDGDGVNNVSEGEGGDTSAYETDDSYDFSDFDTDSTDGRVSRHVVGEELEPDVDDVNRDERKRGATKCHEDQVDEGEEGEELQPVSRLTAKDLALYALGRVSTSARSDLESPVASLNGNGNGSLEKRTAALKSCTPAPTSYTPTSSAFPSTRALEKRPVFATTGRTRDNRTARPSTSVSVSSYVRRSRPRAPMDLKNHLPPPIGVLSGLSSGSSTFSIDPSCFYDVTWKSGEFAFSVQQVYTDENEYEFDDCGDEPQLFLRMLLNTERSVCKSFRDVRVGDVLIRVGDTNVSDLGLEGSGTVLTKFFAKLMAQTPIRLTFQRMSPSDWEGGVEL